LPGTKLFISILTVQILYAAILRSTILDTTRQLLSASIQLHFNDDTRHLNSEI
jgi:hypothetical protein